MLVSRAVPALCLLALAGRAGAQELKLSKPAGVLKHQFSSITGLRELADGRVLVSDGIDQVVVRADFVAQKLDTVGRAGQGPGEYKTPDLLLPMPAGGTLLTDLGNGRLTVFDQAGKYRESFPIAQGTIGAGGGVRLMLPRGTDARGRLYYQPAGLDPKADSAALLRFDRASGKADTVARVKLAKAIIKSSGGAGRQSISQRPPPYPAQEGWVVAEDGGVALVRMATYRVDWVLPNGTRVVGQPLAAQPVSIGAAEKKEYQEELATNGLQVQVQNVNGQVSMSFTRGRRGESSDDEDASGTEWPATKPPATGVYFAGADGTAWIERSVPAKAPRAYDVVGRDGRLVRTVVLPVGRRAVGVGAHGVYARYVDDTGVAYLERYDLK